MRTTASARAAVLSLIVAMTSAGTGCGTGSSPPTIAILEARLSPSPSNHLSATITFGTSEASTPTITVLEPEGASWRVPASGIQSDGDGRSHHATILGLKAEHAYQFRISGPGVIDDQSLSYTPGPMPRGFPVIQVLESRPEEMSPGFTLFALGTLLGGSWLVAVDAQGDPVWYHRLEPQGIPAGLRPLPDGRVAFVTTDWDEIRIVGLLGDRVATLRAADLGLDTLHHEPNLGPDGHLLVLSSELASVSGYPGGQTLNLAADVLSEVTQDGSIVQQWHMLDVLDPHVILPDSLIPFWQGRYPEVSGLRDWSHLNSVWYDASDDSFVISSLNLHLIFKMNRGGGLAWVIGRDDPDTTADDPWPWLTSADGERMPARHHSVQLGPKGHVFTYDNAFDSGASRPVELAVDERRREVHEVWDWYDPDRAAPIFSIVGGDFDPLPGGNVLVQAGLNTDLSEWVTEIRPSTGEKVFQIRVGGGGGFNAVRVPSLYGTMSE